MDTKKLREAANLIGECADDNRSDSEYGGVSRHLSEIEHELRTIIRRAGGDGDDSPRSRAPEFRRGDARKSSRDDDEKE